VQESCVPIWSGERRRTTKPKSEQEGPRLRRADGATKVKLGHGVHIAHIDFVEIYRTAFKSPQAARAFVKNVEDLPVEQARVKVALHQAARMVWLGDRIDEVARGRPAFQILFYIIAAEAVSKSVFDFKGRGQSKKYVLTFFEKICTATHRTRLDHAFGDGHYFDWRTAANILYSVRNEVAHESFYYTFHLQDDDDPTPTMTYLAGQSFEAHISLRELRQIILEGAVRGVEMLLRGSSV
jgi:hypothetical protein